MGRSCVNNAVLNVPRIEPASELKGTGRMNALLCKQLNMSAAQNVLILRVIETTVGIAKQTNLFVY